MYLKLLWARFFTLAGWEWRLSSRPGFDFVVTLPCNKSGCGPHPLLVRVCNKSASALAAKHDSAFSASAYVAPHPALFGDGPANTYWEMTCAGRAEVCGVVDELQPLWERAHHE